MSGRLDPIMEWGGRGQGEIYGQRQRRQARKSACVGLEEARDDLFEKASSGRRKGHSCRGNRIFHSVSSDHDLCLYYLCSA